MLKVGLIGFGGIARVHKGGYAKLAEMGLPIELTAICDIRPEQFGKDMKINLGAANAGSMDGINLYTSVDEMLEKEQLDCVDICLPSYLHTDMTIKCLESGLHVICEKPMALSVEDTDRMIAASKRTGKKLMIALCLRFDNGYNELKKMVDSKVFGKVKNAYFERLSCMPSGWENWYHDDALSGGVEFDLHVHDLDMARYIFGDPKWVSAVKNGRQNINTRLGYDDLTVVCTADWGCAYKFQFASGFRVVFEDATVVLDHGNFTIYPEKGDIKPHEFTPNNCYAEEIRYFFEDVVLGGKENTVNPLESSQFDVKMILAMRESYKQNGKVIEL